MQKVTTFLMFPAGAEEAVNLYVSLFKNARITSVNHFDAEPAQGAAMLTFEIDGQEFYAMDGGPHFKFEQGMSLMVDCESQAEVDRLYDSLSEGGEKQPCGWVKDKFGVSWQIVPTVLTQLMSDPDPVKARRVTEAMLQMHKIDIAALQRAYAGG
jgi:predicted 3-demethylubiquinone-9 3-methyltransferase (glyoxalase superfamily)